MTEDCARLIADMGNRAHRAARILASADSATKALAVRSTAVAIRKNSDEILAANREDLSAGSHLAPAMRERLTLDSQRLDGIIASIESLARLPDPVGETIKTWTQPNGLRFERVRVPLGVIGVIYESRPNVTVDAGLLCLMAGNAAILRGGSEAVHSNRALHSAIATGLAAAGLPADAVQLVPTQDRAAVGAMLSSPDAIDVIIPRGGKTLVARVQDEARVPVLAHLDGICHIYVDRDANPAMACKIVHNAKLRRTGICGAAETLLIDADAPDLARSLVAMLIEKGCEVRGDPVVASFDNRVVEAQESDWGTEYLDAVIAVRMVDHVDGAMQHIAQYGSQHTDAIVTGNAVTAAAFLVGVDSAIVMHNASTQYADGGEFGFGAEIGIATGRLHARGPVALEGLTTYKTIVRGDGHARP